MSNVSYAAVMIAAGGVILFGLRALPFLLFGGKPLGGAMKYWSAVLAPASIGMLVLYCLKDVNYLPLHVCPEFYAVTLVALLQWYCRQMWLSVCAGTIFYILIQPMLASV